MGVVARVAGAAGPIIGGIALGLRRRVVGGQRFGVDQHQQMIRIGPKFRAGDYRKNSQFS
jgi:hypothetical protein